MAFKSSCSDNGEYPNFCLQAANDNQIYATFRRNPIYTSVVETVSKESGQDYFQMALLQTPGLREYFDDFVTSERVGSPHTFPYKEKLFSRKYLFSPTTIRYIKVLSDLLQFFGSLDGMNIVEIGGGYGGLCKIISDFCRIESYTLIDLKPALNLSQKFLSEFSLANIHYLTEEDLSHCKQYDLVISNYAFSEINRNVQNLYMKNILQMSSRGYLLCNFKTHTWQEDQMTGDDFRQTIKNVKSFINHPILSKLDLLAGIELLIWENT